MEEYVYVTLCDIETHIDLGTPEYQVREENDIFAGVHSTLENAITALKARTKNLKIDEDDYDDYVCEHDIYYRLEGEYNGSFYKYRIEKTKVM